MKGEDENLTNSSDQKSSDNQKTQTPDDRLNRRSFAKGLASTLGVTAVLGAATVSTLASENVGAGPLKNKILNRIKTDLEADPAGPSMMGYGKVGGSYTKPPHP